MLYRSIEEFLQRPRLHVHSPEAQRLILGRRILVTGAAGSIGSELCRQTLALHPEGLLLFDRHENGLYTVLHELTAMRSGAPIHSFVGDVTDLARLDGIMAEFRPHVVFHAAAYKHVPLMEANPCEAVKNNIFGTQNIIETAERHGVGRFVLISTDKAVNPSSVMGATKRVAEFLVQAASRQAMDGHGASMFTGVRFGNVLGSNGSVVPHFIEQIRRGGPVTVTHPDVRRYFMVMSEAVQLVLNAAALARGGDMFVLEMGEQIRILDLARQLIRLSGFVPEEQIPIVFIGLRPGEKLAEELVEPDERLQATTVSGVFSIEAGWLPSMDSLASTLEELQRLAWLGRSTEVIQLLKALVPSYAPGSETIQRAGTRLETVKAVQCWT
jgi:FlaA1/EpsC-like NDP-sugar epimerase